MHISELREMSTEQLRLMLRETCEGFFRLRIQSQTERLDAPSELRRHRKMIAQVKTLLREREIAEQQIAEDGARLAAGSEG